MLEAIFEFIFQFILEVVLEVVFEILSELGFSGFEKAADAARRNPFVAGVGYVLMGIILGGLSALLLPHDIIQNETLKIVNRFLSPLFLGFMLCFVSWVITRRDRNEGLFRLDKFVYGVIFGASYSAARFFIL